MRFRTVTLALVLSCGLMSMAEAKQKPAVHRVKARKFKAPKNQNKNLKPRKFKAAKRRPRK